MRRSILALLLLSACHVRPTVEREDRSVHLAIDERTAFATDARSLWTRPRDPLPSECEQGDIGECVGTIRKIHGPMRACPCAHCMKTRDGSWRWNRAECNTPIVVSFDDRAVEFTRPDAAFTIGLSERTEWVSSDTPWLGLDRDGSGCIESARELFAGFSALVELDTNGDGRIDARDPAFAELALWSDRDQDKRCTPSELSTLATHGIDSLALGFRGPVSIPFGSYEGDTSMLTSGARLVDVHLAPID